MAFFGRFGPPKTPKWREACNFYVFYEVDDDEYGSWVLLESTAGGKAEGDAPAAAPEAAGSV